MYELSSKKCVLNRLTPPLLFWVLISGLFLFSLYVLSPRPQFVRFFRVAGSKTSSVSPTGALNGFGGSNHSPTWGTSSSTTVAAAAAVNQQQHEALERALSSLQLQQSGGLTGNNNNGPTTPLLQVENGLGNGSVTNAQWTASGVGGGVQFGTFGSALTPPSDSGSSAGGGALMQPMFSQGLPTNLLTQQIMSGLNPPIRQAQMHSISIRCKIGSLGPGVSQFNSPHGFCLAPSEDIVVADTNNHRIQIFDKNGNFKGQFGVAGKEEGQLWYPRKVEHYLFRFLPSFAAIRYIDIVAGLCVDQEGRVVAVDSVSPTVFCIDENGELIHWFDCSNYMKEPSDIAVYDREYFICDFKGHCVCVFNQEGYIPFVVFVQFHPKYPSFKCEKSGRFLRKIGCEGVTNFPNGIDISDAGDVLVGDSHGNRFHVAVFKRSGELQVEYECPYVKVSRCCGLRITTEGYIITIAKNNHHVLILDTLYIAGQ
uniref:Brain tumor protein n=1 Tax=Romanomermis culicivorax TaxID=13658 RepID=A0A915JNI6_ROMCU